MNFDKEPELRRRSWQARHRGSLIAGGIALTALVAWSGWAWATAKPALVPVVANPEAQASVMRAEVETLVKEAARYRADGSHREAAAKLAEAVALLRDLNQRFAQTSSASGARLQAIEAERQTAEVAVELTEVARLDREAASHLRRREFREAGHKIDEAWEKLTAVPKQLPLARPVDEGVRQRSGYLHDHHAEAEAVQGLVDARLRPSGSAFGMAVLDTDSRDELFTRVMGRGATDSAANRTEFRRRLSWLIGQPVMPVRDVNEVMSGKIRSLIDKPVPAK